MTPSAVNAHDDLVKALEDSLRILEAVRLSAGLGKKQIERVEKHKALLAALSRQEAQG